MRTCTLVIDYMDGKRGTIDNVVYDSIDKAGKIMGCTTTDGTEYLFAIRNIKVFKVIKNN